MQNIFEIKNIVFGAGKPVVCVPVVAQKKEEIIKEIATLAKNNVPMIEWRVDWFENVSDEEEVKQLLAKIKPFVEKTVFLFTFRTKKQGGHIVIPEQKILRLNELAAQSGAVDIIDLEFFEATFPMKEIKRFQKFGVRIIASHHDFELTPKDEIMRMLLEKMQEGGADIVKLAVMPQKKEDVLRLLNITAQIKEKYPTLPIVTMSMGKEGMISRVSGEAFGSCITFGASQKASAPGQLAYQDLEQILTLLHKGFNGE